MRFEHGAQGNEVVVQGQAAQGEGCDRLRVGEGEFPADARAEGEADNVRAGLQFNAEVVLGGDGAQQLGEQVGEQVHGGQWPARRINGGHRIDRGHRIERNRAATHARVVGELAVDGVHGLGVFEVFV